MKSGFLVGEAGISTKARAGLPEKDEAPFICLVLNQRKAWGKAEISGRAKMILDESFNNIKLVLSYSLDCQIFKILRQRIEKLEFWKFSLHFLSRAISSNSAFKRLHSATYIWSKNPIFWINNGDPGWHQAIRHIPTTPINTSRNENQTTPELHYPGLTILR